MIDNEAVALSAGEVSSNFATRAYEQVVKYSTAVA